MSKHYSFLGTLTHGETGEMMPALIATTVNQGPLAFALVDRRILFDLILQLDGSSKDALCVMLRDMKDYSNIFKGSYAKIGELAHMSPASVKRAMDDLQSRDIIRMVEYKVWMINPKYCWTTDSEKQIAMQFWYDSLETKESRMNRRAKNKKGGEDDVLRSVTDSVAKRAEPEESSDIHS